MHPMVKPALRRAWRERDRVQFGVTPAHAVVLGPVDPATGCLLALLDGTRGLDLLREEARKLDLPDGHVDSLVAELEKAGVLDDPPGHSAAVDALRNRDGALDRLRPDAASLSTVHPEPGGALERLAARRAVRVQVRGAGRVGAAIAAVLSASGVGHVEVLDGGRTEPWDIAPGGLPEEAVGERRDVSARRLVRRVAPGAPPRAAKTPQAGAGGEPGLALVVVAPRDGFDAYVPDPGMAADWVAAGTPHLYAGVIEGTGVVGPLVLPGGSACAGCLALQRADRDPGWPRMVAQWRSGRRSTAVACDLGLATTVAGLASAHALSYLDGGLPATTGSRWEASLPLLDWRAARIPPHPECGCGAAGNSAAGKTGGERASGAGARHATMAG
ncbi:ThiF family adenylyltransferase [Streptomyces sp. NPDC050738]|uniref:ThiF family adenylyltransferase n=1 Tax=Streptomyces sp. NPDC050738 TaxID=3154744 RepID=UPI003437468C